MDALLGEEVLLLVFHFCGILQSGVHVAVAVCVRDALHGSGGGLTERDRRAGAFDQEELVLLASFFSLFLELFTFCDLALEAPDTKAGEGGRDAEGRGDDHNELGDCHFQHGSSPFRSPVL